MEDNYKQTPGGKELENQTRNQYSGSGDFAPGPPESGILQNDPSEIGQDQTEIAKQKTVAATDPEKLDKI